MVAQTAKIVNYYAVSDVSLFGHGNLLIDTSIIGSQRLAESHSYS